MKINIEQIQLLPHHTTAMSLLLKRILPMLAILVVACAQVFGMHRGFMCDHHGATVVTDAEHCHHEEETGKTGFVSCSEDSHKDDGEHEDTEHHAPLTVDLQAGTAGLTAVYIPIFVAVLVAEKPVHDWVLIQALTGG